MSGNQVGLIIGGTFGLVYVLVNAGVIGGPVGIVLQVLGVAAYAGLLVVLFRGRRAARATADVRPPQFGRGYALVVVGEVVALFLGNIVINAVLRLPQAILPWITFVVGVHFVVLGRVWRAPSIGWVGGALAVCGIAGFVAAVAGAPTAVIATLAGVLPGAVLLAGSWWGALRPAVPARD